MRAGWRSLRRDWRFVVALLTAVNLLELIAYVHMARFTPLFLRDELRIAEADVPRLVGLLASAAMLVGVPLSPFWGALADRYSRKWLILRSEFAQIVSYSMMALSGDIWMLLAARLVFGIAFGNSVMMIAIQTLVTPQPRIGTAIAVFQATTPLGMSLAPLLGTVLIKTVGLRGMFVFDLLLVAVVALLLILCLEEPPGRDPSVSFGDRLRQVMTLSTQVPALRWSFILQFFMAGAGSGIDPFVPIAIQRANATSPWGWDDPTALGITLGVNGMVTAALMPIVGRLTDRLGPVRLMALSTAMAMVCVFSLSAVQSLPAVWGLLLLLAVPQAATSTALFAYLGTQVPREHRSGVLSLTPFPRNIASLFSPTIAAAATGLGFGAVFVVAGGFWALAVGAALRLTRLSPPTRQIGPTGLHARGTGGMPR